MSKLRITPACAGKTGLAILRRHLARDHPRVCGKNNHVPVRIDEILGSPPRVREKRYQYTGSSIRLRITPACAGKTFRHEPLECVPRDHPRVCGKNKGDIVSDDVGSGSPPRVREKPVKISTACALSGITPACAGKTT